MDNDPIKILEDKIKEYRRKNIFFKTEEDYKKSKNYILDLEDLSYIASRFYGSHEYTDFWHKNLELIMLLDYKDKFKLLKELYCAAKDCTFMGFLIQDLVKDNKIPEEELKNIKENFKPVAYRGYNEVNLEDGCSYTLDFEVANWFAKRFKVFDKKGYVIKIDIDIDDIIFYNDHEKEVFIRKDKLKNKNKEIINI